MSRRRPRRVFANEAGAWVISHYAPGERQPFHEHARLQFSITLAGRYRETYAGGVDEVSGATALLKPAGYGHADEFGPEGALVFSFNARGPEWSVRNRGARSAAPVMNDWRRLAFELVRAAEPDAELMLDVTTGMLEVLDTVDDEAPDPRRAPPWLSTAREALGDSDLSIDAIARAVGVHRVHLSRTFRRFHGQPMVEYRRRVRLGRAVSAFVRSATSLSEAAVEAGFSDQAHMTREMQREWGWTPGMVRRALDTSVQDGHHHRR